MRAHAIQTTEPHYRRPFLYFTAVATSVGQKCNGVGGIFYVSGRRNSATKRFLPSTPYTTIFKNQRRRRRRMDSKSAKPPWRDVWLLGGWWVERKRLCEPPHHAAVDTRKFHECHAVSRRRRQSSPAVERRLHRFLSRRSAPSPTIPPL